MSFAQAIVRRALPRGLVRLLQRSSVSMSQAGQDLWVYGEVFNEQRGGFFVDVGAHDGVDISNTFILEKRYRWRGICIEGNPLTFAALSRNREADCVNVCIDSQRRTVKFAPRGVSGGIVSGDTDNREWTDAPLEVEALPLVEVLEAHGVPKTIDYLSIDIEGAEDRALLGFPFERYTFNCLTVERPSAALRERFRQADYLLVKEIPELDCFYIHRSFEPTYCRNVHDFGAKRFLAKRWY